MKLEFSEEEQTEHTRIAKEYQRQSNMRHNQQEKDLTTKIYLQEEALNAMPANLRMMAVVLDETPPPPDRPWPVWDTPPIEGFNMNDYLKKDEEDEEEFK